MNYKRKNGNEEWKNQTKGRKEHHKNFKDRVQGMKRSFKKDLRGTKSDI